MTSEYPGAEVDGFEMGMFVSYADGGDAWVRAPAGSIGHADLGDRGTALHHPLGVV